MALNREERETVIRSAAVDQFWDCVTADERWIGYLTRMGYTPSPDHQFSDPYVHFTIPYRDLRVLRSGRVKQKPHFPLKRSTYVDSAEVKAEKA